MVCALWPMSTRHQRNLSEREILTERWLLHATSSGNHPLSFLFSFQFPLVGRLTLLFGRALLFSSSSFFVSSRPVCEKLLGHTVLNSTSRVVSILSLRVKLLSFIFSSPPTTSPLPLSCVLPPSAAAALILLTCLLLGARLALYGNCCLTYNCRVSDFACEHASSLSVAFHLVPSRPSHAPALTSPATSSVCIRSLCYGYPLSFALQLLGLTRPFRTTTFPSSSDQSNVALVVSAS